MNERIRELVDKCWEEDGIGPTYFNPEKFAELIVRECIHILNKRYMGDQNREDMEVKRCIEDVKKHFGIE